MILGTQTEYGSRIPALYIRNADINTTHDSGSESGFHICTGLNNQKMFCKRFPIEIGTKYHVIIQQYQDFEHGATWYQIEIDGSVVFSKINNQPRNFESVKLFVSNPWNDAFGEKHGILENFSACNTNPQ